MRFCRFGIVLFVLTSPAQAQFMLGVDEMLKEAIRSFREAWKRDPDCAICHRGEAWSWGCT